MPVTPALRRLRQEGFEFKACLGDVVRSCLKNKKERKKRKKEGGKKKTQF
jgi:hypothetical protein